MKKLINFGLLLFLFSTMVFAQVTTSTLVGTVSTPDGVLPGATVVVRDNRTGREITVTSGSDGGFRVPNLEIGLYTVTVSSPGFSTFVAEQVRLETGKDYTLAAALAVGAITETVTVTAGADIVNATDAQQNGLISNRQLEQLPLLTRNPLGFVPLQAGVASNPNQLSTINGIRTSATNITIEGVNVQDNFIRANATDFSPARPLVDEIEEFTVTGQANADRGFGAGQIQFPIRRGGNRYSGSAYVYNRNSEFSANSFANNAVGIERPFRNRNEFGARFQGPLPFLNFGEGGPVTTSGRDKLFFFVFYQKTIDILPTSKLTTVLTNNARNGLFTYTAAANDPANGIVAGQQVTVNLFNPAFGTGITGINPLILSRIISRVPTGNTTETGDQRNTTGFRFTQSNNQEQTNYTVRLDYNINDRNAVKFTHRYVYQTLERADIDNSFNPRPLVDQPSRNPFYSFGWTSAVSSNFSNEFSGGYYYSDPSFLRQQAPPSALLTIPLITNPDVNFQDQGRETSAFNIQNNSSLQIGRHGIRFGGQFQAIKITPFNNAGITPTFTVGVGTQTPQISVGQFTNTTLFPGQVPVAQRAQANALLALLGGIVSGGSQTFNVTSQTSGFVQGQGDVRNFETEIFGFYATDQWRIRPNLTLNFGLRYDVYTGLRNPEALFFEPVIAEGRNPIEAILDPNGRYQFVGGNAGKAGQFFKTDFNNFAPNVSFAYTPGWNNGFGRALFGERKTVIRGGFRVSYINDEFVASARNAGVANAGLGSTSNVAINPLTGTGALNVRVDGLPTVAPPVFNPDRTFATNNTAAFNFFGTVYAIDPNIKTPMVQEYSLGIQREVGFNTALEIRYVGSRSGNLVRALDFNQVEIRSNGFLADFNRARNNLLLCNATTGCTTGGNFNAAVPGSQQLTVFPQLASGGLLTNATITGQLIAGTPGDLATIYIQNGLTGGFQFLPNPNTGVADILGNYGRSNYNSLQVEVRRRFSQGLQLQANYTFGKSLTNSQGSVGNSTGDTQTRFDPQVDNLNPALEWSRAITDQTHKFNLNGFYELPFGRGKMFFNRGGIVNTLLGGFVFSGILQVGSGSPISFNDPRGTLNRGARSARQTALTSLTKDELKRLVGVYNTPNGIFFLPPEVLGRNPDGSINTAIGGTGRGANGFGSPTFAGQVFFNNAPGQTSGLERSVVNGPSYYSLDLSLIKRFAFTERYSVQLQADAFNVTNKAQFFLAQGQDINSVNFGRLSTFGSRIMQFSARINF